MSSGFIKSVDERTGLAGANRLEILLFSLGFDNKYQREEVFGINVFKVKEVLHSPEITRAPDVPPGIEGLVSLRGTMVPVINLAQFCGLDVREEPDILIVTEYNRNTQALLVNSVEHILRMQWNDIKVPPPMLAYKMGGLITAVTELDDKRIVLILDVERIFTEAAAYSSDVDEFSMVEQTTGEKTILFADDSSVARKQIQKTLEQQGVKYIAAKNGKEAWDKLQELAERAHNSNIPIHSLIQVILTDIEMPEMDGYVLTRMIKSDSRFYGIPVVMHSSLSAQANIAMGTNVGADHYVPKFNPVELSNVLRPLLEGKKLKK